IKNALDPAIGVVTLVTGMEHHDMGQHLGKLEEQHRLKERGTYPVVQVKTHFGVYVYQKVGDSWELKEKRSHVFTPADVDTTRHPVGPPPGGGGGPGGTGGSPGGGIHGLLPTDGGLQRGEITVFRDVLDGAGELINELQRAGTAPSASPG